MQMNYPPAPANTEEWDQWSLNELYLFVADILNSPYNDDRVNGDGPALDHAMGQLASVPWLHNSYSRTHKLKLVEFTAEALGEYAPATKRDLRGLWEGIANKPVDAAWVAQRTVEGLPEAGATVARTIVETTDAGIQAGVKAAGKALDAGANAAGLPSAGASVGLLALGALGVLGAMAYVK